MFEPAKSRVRDLERVLRRTAGRSRVLKHGYRRLATKYRRISDTGFEPENIIWIFGSGRSGSTWLRSMMEDLDRHQLWEEPMIGQLFGQFHDRAPEVELRRPDFIMADAAREGWIRSIRNFVLDEVRTRFPTLSKEGYLVVKEPNGSVGAPLLMEALPESRMILLVRDPRDIVSSMLDGARQGGWMYARRKESDEWKRRTRADEDPDNFVRNRSRKYLQQAGSAKRAYDAHGGPKVLVRYEDLRADTLGTMKRLYSTIGIPVDEEELARVVHKHSWENIPEGEKGEGKFYRKATPGGWREDLTPEQARVIEKVTAPLLNELYPSS